MNDKSKDRLGIFNFIISFITLLTLIFGPILGFTFKGKYEADQAKALANLAKLQAIASMSEILKFVSDIRPIVQFESHQQQISPNEILITLNMENIGKHSVRVELDPTMSELAELTPDGKKNHFFTKDKDYTINYSGIGTIGPGQKTSDTMRITVLTGQMPSEYEIVLRFKLTSDQAMVSIAKNMLAGIVAPEELDAKSNNVTNQIITSIQKK